jgi:hypothetical protein
MNRNTTVFRENAPHPTPLELQILERNARRLRAEHVGDLLTLMAVAIDLNVRRVAHRAAVILRGR